MPLQHTFVNEHELRGIEIELSVEPLLAGDGDILSFLLRRMARLLLARDPVPRQKPPYRSIAEADAVALPDFLAQLHDRHMWTAAPGKHFFDVSNDLVDCGHMSGLLARSIFPLALMKSDNLDPYQVRELCAHDD